MLKYLHENGCRYPVNLANVVDNGNSVRDENSRLEVLKYLRTEFYKNECPFDEEEVGIRAAKNGYLEIIKYLHENGCPLNDSPLSTRVCDFAAENNHLEVLKYLHKNGYPITRVTYVYAAKKVI